MITAMRVTAVSCPAACLLLPCPHARDQSLLLLGSAVLLQIPLVSPSQQLPPPIIAGDERCAVISPIAAVWQGVSVLLSSFPATWSFP